MKNGGWIAAVVVALALGVVGYLVGKSQAPPPAAPPPGGGAGGAAVNPSDCAAWATLTFDTATKVLTLAPKPDLPVEYPSIDPQNRFVCWLLVVPGNAFPFDKLELDVRPPGGIHGQPVLAGSSKFTKQNRVVSLRFFEEPKWPGGTGPQEVKVPYDVVAVLADGTTLTVDPDIIIRKPPGGLNN